MKFILVLALMFVLLGCSQAALHGFPERVQCPLCIDYTLRALIGNEDPMKVCTDLQACDFLNKKMMNVSKAAVQGKPAEEIHARRLCISLNLCVPEVEPHHAYLKANVKEGPWNNYRLSLIHGARNKYSAVRISFIDDYAPEVGPNRSQEFQQFFRTSEGGWTEPFRYRWNNKYLYSALVNVTPGKNTIISPDASVNVTVHLPEYNAGVKGIIVGDPCFSSKYLFCPFGREDIFNVLPRLTSIFNAAMDRSYPGNNGKGDIDYWMVLGDMFYDRYTELSDQFFSLLSEDVKSTFFSATIGNHDFWVMGTPWLATKDDHFGYGYAQYYTLDTMAATRPGSQGLFNFTNDPDHPASTFQHLTRLATEDNFFFYNRIGNLAFVGYSGAHDWNDMQQNFQEACLWFNETQPAVAIIIGHWDVPELGCEDDMSVPAVYRHMRHMAGCRELGGRLKAIMGHTHCNQIKSEGETFMTAGQGMEGCGNFGLPYVDTTEGRLEILYFEFMDFFHGVNKFDDVFNCVKQSGGLSKCKHLAKVWFNDTLSNL